MRIESVHFRVSGRVQGVGFRQATLRTAQSLNLAGWVKNLPDGRVETYAEGESSAIDRLLTWSHRGPQHSQVDHVELMSRKPTDGTLDGFEIHR